MYALANHERACNFVHCAYPNLADLRLIFARASLCKIPKRANGHHSYFQGTQSGRSSGTVSSLNKIFDSYRGVYHLQNRNPAPRRKAADLNIRCTREQS